KRRRNNGRQRGVRLFRLRRWRGWGGALGGGRGGKFPRRTRALAPLLLTAACTGPSLDWQGRPDVPLADYQQAFARAAGERFDAEATPAEILDRAAASRVLWLGDHHPGLLLHDRQRGPPVQLTPRGTPLALRLPA